MYVLYMCYLSININNNFYYCTLKIDIEKKRSFSNSFVALVYFSNSVSACLMFKTS